MRHPTETLTLATPHGLLQIAQAAERPRRQRARAGDHRRFVADHWPELAAAAFEGYRRHGAGAVVLWREAPPRRLLRRAFEPERLWYTTQIHALPGTAEADFDGWEAEQLESYDPQGEALVVFVEGGRPQGYRIAGDPAPPAARRLAGASLN